jgi:hypothetical protein
MDDGLERIRRLSQEARTQERTEGLQAEEGEEGRESDRERTAQLVGAIPKRLQELADASNGDFTFENSIHHSPDSTAYDLWWRGNTPEASGAQLVIHTRDGYIEWQWWMGKGQPRAGNAVPTSEFDLTRLDALVAAMAEWRHPGPPPHV